MSVERVIRVRIDVLMAVDPADGRKPPMAEKPMGTAVNDCALAAAAAVQALPFTVGVSFQVEHDQDWAPGPALAREETK